jgi:hypothetical protein
LGIAGGGQLAVARFDQPGGVEQAKADFQALGTFKARSGRRRPIP